MTIVRFCEEWARGLLRNPAQIFRKTRKWDCPNCGFHGWFIDAGARPEVRCPNCASKERDRIIALFVEREGIDFSNRHILHFAPERPLFRKLIGEPHYIRGDICKSRVSDTIVDITRMQFGADHFDYVICNHVLEHVPEDRLGMAECFRVLKPGGLALFSVPLDPDRAETWEADGMTEAERDEAFGAGHVRYYGRDFTERLAAAGFSVSEIGISDADDNRYRLRVPHVDKVFAARKPDAA